MRSTDYVLEELYARACELERELVSTRIERDHWRATAKELIRSGQYRGGAEERGLNDMAGVLHEE